MQKMTTPEMLVTASRIQISKAVIMAQGVIMLRPPRRAAKRLGRVRPKTEDEFMIASR